jgi:hypothetical protein|tara:strand:- start:8278 stop:8772 length:495 start_codon:yes stop_codon:yes gene_type:complete
MKKIVGVFAMAVVLFSCNQPTTEVIVNKQAGEWVSSGAKYSMGDDTNVATVKAFIEGYEKMNVETIFNFSQDSVKVFLHNVAAPMYMNRGLLSQMFSQYDSIQAKPLYFLPYQIAGWEHSIVEVVSKEKRFLKDGTIENVRLLEKFMIDKEGKVFTIRQFDAAW